MWDGGNDTPTWGRMKKIKMWSHRRKVSLGKTKIAVQLDDAVFKKIKSMSIKDKHVFLLITCRNLACKTVVI